MGGRRSGAPRTLDEVAEKSGIEKKIISRNYRELYNNDITPESHEPVSFVSKFRNELHLTAKNEAFANNLIKASKNPPKTYFGFGKSPIGMAAATLYISSIIHNEPRTQREIAEVTDVTEVTIRNIYKAFMKGKEDKIDKKTGKETKGHKPLEILIKV
jgi:transcription initiation factor TFIIB